MKKILYIVALSSLVGLGSCSKTDFSDAYTDPSKISKSSVEKQFAGALNSSMSSVLPSYWNYFVILRTTLQYYNQAVGWVNYTGQYSPGSAAVTDRWNSYYSFVAQYREMEKIYNALPADDQELYKIFMLSAKIYFYDHTQKTVDLHGDIPWSKAGMLSTNGGDYMASLPAYDAAEDIYTTMLDDLADIADDLNSITINSGILVSFKNQDLINKGDLTKWKKYCNSLRLRMLTRVSGSSVLGARATSEISTILSNSVSYPLVEDFADNIQVKVHDLNTGINSKGFRTGLEDWNGNMASKPMIDHMDSNSDPRLRLIFEPGVNADGSYMGIDPLDDATDQSEMIADGVIAMYNRTTLSRNEYFPGMLINAAEVHFLKAEAYARAGNNAAAKDAYEDGITQSVNQYIYIRSISNSSVSPAIAPIDVTEVEDYLISEDVDWDNAATLSDRLSLIMVQKWIHLNVVQPMELWAEVRRLDPPLSFQVDGASPQQQPPVRWQYPSSEATYNKANYNAVSSGDNLTTKLFWDVQ